MTRVVIYFSNNNGPISFDMKDSVSKARNDFLRLMRANEFFSLNTENGAIILQSSTIAGSYFEKD